MSVELGTIIYIAVKPIFKIYMIIGVGILMARLNVLTVDTSRNISSLAVMVLLPALSFAKIVSNIDNGDIKQIATIVIVSFFMMGAGTIGTFLIGVILGCPREWYGGLLSCGLLPNISDLPIAYLQSMEASNVLKNVDKGVSYVCIFLALQMLCQFNFGGFKLIELDFNKELDASEDEEAKIESEGIEPPADAVRSLSSHSEASKHRLAVETSNNLQQSSSIGTQGLAADDNGELLSPTSTISSLDSIIDNTSVNARNPRPLYREPSALSKIATYTSALSRKASVPNSILSPRDGMRDVPTENMNDIVKVYSRFDQVKKDRKEERDMEQKEESSSSSSVEDTLLLSNTSNMNFGQRQLLKVKVFTRKAVRLLKKLRHVHYGKLLKQILIVLFTSTLKPVSITIILSITVCMIPWVKALFVHTHQAHLPDAPDFEPPLSFIMDFASYLGAAEVPIGLLLLGGTIGRLSFKHLPPGTWKTPVGVTIFKLFIFPIIGCALNSKLHKDGLFYGESILYFISNINFCLPPATSLIYITAFYTPVDAKSTIQMDCLALAYIFHYICLVVCLPFVTTYTMKVSLGY